MSIPSKPVSGAKAQQLDRQEETRKTELGAAIKKTSSTTQEIESNTTSKIIRESKGKPFKSKSRLAFEKQQKASLEAKISKSKIKDDKALLPINNREETAEALAKAKGDKKLGMAQPKYVAMMGFLGIIPSSTKLRYNFEQFKWELPPDNELPAKFDLGKRDAIEKVLIDLPDANGFNQVLKTLLDHKLIDAETHDAAKEAEPNLTLSPEDQALAESIKTETEVKIADQKPVNKKETKIINQVSVRQYYQPKYERLVQEAHLANLKAVKLLKAQYPEFAEDSSNGKDIELKFDALITDEEKFIALITNEEQVKMLQEQDTNKLKSIKANLAIIDAAKKARTLALKAQQAFDKEQKSIPPSKLHFDTKIHKGTLKDKE